MSLPSKVVPKPAAVAVSGPGSGPSPSSQLRATLTSVSLPPGAPTAPQPGAAPPPQYPLTWVNTDITLHSFYFFLHFSLPVPHLSAPHGLVSGGWCGLDAGMLVSSGGEEVGGRVG